MHLTDIYFAGKPVITTELHDSENLYVNVLGDGEDRPSTSSRPSVFSASLDPFGSGTIDSVQSVKDLSCIDSAPQSKETTTKRKKDERASEVSQLKTEVNQSVVEAWHEGRELKRKTTEAKQDEREPKQNERELVASCGSELEPGSAHAASINSCIGDVSSGNLSQSLDLHSNRSSDSLETVVGGSFIQCQPFNQVLERKTIVSFNQGPLLHSEKQSDFSAMPDMYLSVEPAPASQDLSQLSKPLYSIREAGKLLLVVYYLLLAI